MKNIKSSSSSSSSPTVPLRAVFFASLLIYMVTLANHFMIIHNHSSTTIGLAMLTRSSSSSSSRGVLVPEPTTKIETRPNLSCDITNNKSDGSEQELVYWRSAESDDAWRSPWAPRTAAGSQQQQQYVTFESDNGGFNNVRMAFETVAVFARATGRTLVLPKKEALYFPDPGVQASEYFKHSNSFSDFFPLEELRRRIPGSLITMNEFLERECYSGHLMQPPHAAEEMHGRKLRDFLRSLALHPRVFMPRFKDGGRKSLLAFPPAESKKPGVSNNYSGTAAAAEKMEFRHALEVFAGDRTVTWFEKHWLNATVVHFARSVRISLCGRVDGHRDGGGVHLSPSSNNQNDASLTMTTKPTNQPAGRIRGIAF